MLLMAYTALTAIMAMLTILLGLGLCGCEVGNSFGYAPTMVIVSSVT